MRLLSDIESWPLQSSLYRIALCPLELQCSRQICKVIERFVGMHDWIITFLKTAPVVCIGPNRGCCSKTFELSYSLASQYIFPNMQCIRIQIFRELISYPGGVLLSVVAVAAYYLGLYCLL